jgi:hypothetical protein
MLLQRVGLSQKPRVSYKMKQYLTQRMDIYLVLLNKYGRKAVENF